MSQPPPLEIKTCISCPSERAQKTIDHFYIRSDTGKYRAECIDCSKLRAKKHREANPEHTKEQKDLWYQDNKETISEERKKERRENGDALRAKDRAYRAKHVERDRSRRRRWAADNPEKVKASKKRDYEKNKEKRLAKSKKWQQDNKEYRSQYIKEYKAEHKEHIRDLNREYDRKKRKSNPCHRLRLNVSRAINRHLKGEKRGQSILQFLPYSMEELVQHIEAQFEPWMNHDNYGQYDPKEWDDANQSTWKWQLDHIIPHSTFNYETMDCDEFRACWALSNLRPLSAKQNIIDGSTRVRHKSKPTKKPKADKPKKSKND